MKSTSREQSAEELMEQIVAPDNLERAWKRVRSNGGAPGPDGITIDDFPDHCREHWPGISRQLLDGTYTPSAARRKSIAKPDGGERHLAPNQTEQGPNVMDRLIQQAVLQVLTPIFDPGFSESSFGFRPQRSAQDAAKRVQQQIRAGYRHCIEAGGQSSEKPRLPHRRGRPERPEHGSASSLWDGAVRSESVRRTNANSGTARRR